MESNHGVPLGAPMPADQRRNHRQWQSVGAISIAASVLVGLVALVDVLETIAEARGLGPQASLLAVVYLLALITAAVVFVVWLWQVRSNAEMVAGPASQRLGKGWAIGAWFCPVVNFWFPHQYVVDVWRASAPNRENSGEGIVLGWWLCYLAANISGRIATYGNGVSVAFVSAGLDVASAVLVVLVIRRITDWQSVARV